MEFLKSSWIYKTIKGKSPCGRQGQAIAVKGDSIYVFGGSSVLEVSDGIKILTEEYMDGGIIIYYNDLYKLTVDPDELLWEKVPQQGYRPCRRDCSSMCCIGNKLYLYGGKDDMAANQCLPTLYVFDLGNNKWEMCKTSGPAPRSLNHTLTGLGAGLYVFAGFVCGQATSDMYMLHVDSLTWVLLNTSGTTPHPRCDHAAAAVGDKIYYFGGCGGESIWFSDLHMFDTRTLSWTSIPMEGPVPRPRACHTVTAHRDKDIYVFGGTNDTFDDGTGTFNDLYKLTVGKKTWEQPVCTGTVPPPRYGHTAVIVHSHLYIIGGVGLDGELADVHVLKLTNPDKRPPVTKQSLKDLHLTSGPAGLHVIQTPKLSCTLPSRSLRIPALRTQHDSQHIWSLSSVKLPRRPTKTLEQSLESVEEEFVQLELDRAELSGYRVALEQERAAHLQLREQQQQQFEELLHHQKTVMEKWLQSQERENDEERQELAKLRVALQEERQQLEMEKEALMRKRKKLQWAIEQINTQ